MATTAIVKAGCLTSIMLSALGTPQGAGLSEGAKLKAVANAYTESAKRLDPFASASSFGIEEDLSKFGDYPSPRFFDRTKKAYQDALAGLSEVHPDALSQRDLRTYRLFKENMEVSFRGFEYPDELLAFNQMDNRLMSYIDDTDEGLTHFPFDSVKHYEDFIKRSEGFPAYVDNEIALLRRGIQENVVLNRKIAGTVPATYKAALETDIEKNPFWRPILFMPDSIGAADRARIAAEFRKMIRERILPGYRKFDKFFKSEYLPRTREGYGLHGLPDADRWYAQSIEKSTNTRLSPEKIHEIGLSEVSRIQGEIEQIRQQLGFKGSYKEFIQSLSEDPKYFYKSSQDMFHAFEGVKEKVAEKIPRYFSLTPKTDYKLVESANPETSASSYFDPTDTQPFGRFVVSSNNPKSVPNFGTATLSLHEAVPGHHFQLALQFERKNELTEYERKLYFSNSFVEGWALYAEYLGREMGMYEDPMQRLGNLVDDMLRAVRLVVDTGIHHYGWTQEQAQGYMARYLAMDAKTIRDEANRYAVWPGQALSYKIGQLKIIELRKYAEKELGPRFDLREFHRAVLENGTVSLSVLEQQVRDWVETRKKGL